MHSSIKDNFSDHQIITELYDKQPDSVVWLTPVFSETDNQKPIDFEVGYCNTAASLILNASKEKIVGSSLRNTTLMDRASIQSIWEQCLQIWSSGENIEFTYFSPGKQKHFNVQRSKVLNGILSITRDHSKIVSIQEEKEQQSRLLNQIIETSTSGISVYESIRDKNGVLLDFRLKLANQRSAEITAFSLEELYKYTVKELMVIRGNRGLFDMVSKVVETGESIYTEYLSEPRNQWVGFSIQKFNDGYLLNYIDISHTKALEKQARDQAEMLNGILNASITGLISLQAIYDSSGKVEDFKFVLLNSASERLLGLKKTDKTYLTLFPSAKKNGFFDLYVNALTTGEPVSKEIFYKGEGYNGWYYISISKMNEDTLVQSFADINSTRIYSPETDHRRTV